MCVFTQWTVCKLLVSTVCVYMYVYSPAPLKFFTLFECCLGELNCIEGQYVQYVYVTDPGVSLQFPDDFRDEECLSRFCFPYDIQRVREGVAVQHFTFVLTDLDGCQRFGFCRLTNRAQTCLCMLSYLPWFEVFYKLLNSLADYITKGQTTEMKVMLTALYKQSLPLAAGSITLQMVPYFIAPDPRGLPSIPENRNLTELIVAVDVANLLQLYASMLFERRILILAHKLSTLTSCVHALGALLYPMHWQHIFIPVLPPHLLDYCCAPMPYLIGVHSSLSEVRSRGLEEVVILNVDTNTLETPFNDLKKIPSDVTSGLKLCLKRQAVSPGCGVSRAFLKSQSLLFGGYRDALQTHEGGEIWFDKESFLDHKSSSMKRFLQSAIHLQFFKQFIDGRLDILNTGKVPEDLFEEEVLKCQATGKSKSYQELVGSLKKGGGGLILNLRSKTNYIKIKDVTSSGLKKVLKHKADNETRTLQRGGCVSYHCAQSDCLQNRLPITQHFGMSRPRRPVSKHGITHDKSSTVVGDKWTGATSGPIEQLDSELQKSEEEEEESLLCDPEEMDLLGEIFDTLSTRSLRNHGQLYATRSLDLFGPDSHDYITRLGPANPSEESLSLSISGSGSLHSWNPESTEEATPLTDDFYRLDTNKTAKEASVFEREVQEEERRKVEDRQEEAKAAINWNLGEEMQDSSDEAEKKEETPERRVTFGHGPLEEIAAQDESNVLKMTQHVGNKTGEQQGGKKTARMQEDVAEEVNPEEESKAVGFQSQTSCDGFLEKKRTEGLVGTDVPCKNSENVQSCQSCDPKSQSDAISYIQEGGQTSVKVSELKKRFEVQWSSHTS
ncbi:DENN domain-containing protein 1B isoform X2 [Dunckerocampus dactyliophorus]|uniref:DENN domain-containing protein 1B isoform X2 n=1 Tax=Dunckerocampus dactyliophorus TaxID=161453 RepID=UPI0024058B5C|nr:DENN domain-containing protein 1B isoform X2 [Dunckerocampus dactyliophorus]